MNWQLLPHDPLRPEDVVVRVLPNGMMESRTVSSFNEKDEDYAVIMQLVADGKLTIGAAE
jgi:hypothetical protein